MSDSKQPRDWFDYVAFVAMGILAVVALSATMHTSYMTGLKHAHVEAVKLGHGEWEVSTITMTAKFKWKPAPKMTLAEESHP